MRSEINLKMAETVKKIEVVSRRLGEAEQRVGEVETFSMEVNETLNQMQRTPTEIQTNRTRRAFPTQQHTDLRHKGGSRGHLHDPLCQSQTELGETSGSNELGIERAHRTLGPK